MSFFREYPKLVSGQQGDVPVPAPDVKPADVFKPKNYSNLVPDGHQVKLVFSKWTAMMWIDVFRSIPGHKWRNEQTKKTCGKWQRSQVLMFCTALNYKIVSSLLLVHSFARRQCPFFCLQSNAFGPWHMMGSHDGSVPSLTGAGTNSDTGMKRASVCTAIWQISVCKIIW